MYVRTDAKLCIRRRTKKVDRGIGERNGACLGLIRSDHSCRDALSARWRCCLSLIFAIPVRRLCLAKTKKRWGFGAELLANIGLDRLVGLVLCLDRHAGSPVFWPPSDIGSLACLKNADRNPEVDSSEAELQLRNVFIALHLPLTSIHHILHLSYNGFQGCSRG